MKVLTLIVAGGLFFLIDQVTKLLAERHAAEERPVPAALRIRIRHVANRRRGPLVHHPRNRMLVWAVLFGIISAIVLEGRFFQHGAARWGLGIALGGSGSNVWDQLRRGAVVDFLDLGCWPVFNLADLGIGIGVTAAMWFLR